MEDLKAALNTKTLKKCGYKASGCINEGCGYITDDGKIFLKRSKDPEAKHMFESEYASLTAIGKTKTVRVPYPITVINKPKNESYLAMEFLELKQSGKYSAILGEKLADLHLHNETIAKSGKSELQYVKQFGFHIPTYIGRISVDNTWMDDWSIFYARNRLDNQIKLIQENKGEREAMELWSQLQLLVPKFFEDIEVKPSLLHGDLWGGNASETDTEPVIFDPGCVYGHHEFEMAMTRIFGGFSRPFYDAYYSKIPKAPGYQTREKLYQLFHYLNHWNHFGVCYRSSCISIMKELLLTTFP